MLLSRIIEWMVPAAQAHEKWFVPNVQQQTSLATYDWFGPGLIAVAAVIAIIYALALRIDRLYERSKAYLQVEARLRPFRDVAALLLGVITGATLLWSAWNGQLLAENLVLPSHGTLALRVVEGAVGLLLMLGLFAPAAAVGLLALYASAFALFQRYDVIDYVHFLGIGLFLLFFARGRYSFDWFLGKPILTSADQRKWAYMALRVFLGFALLWLGIWKFLRPDLHFALMDMYPSFNPYVILGWTGIHMSREAYVFCLAVAETVIGFTLMTGLFTRIFALLVMPTMFVSVIFLGVGELVGHLPIVAALAVLFIYGDTYHKHRDPNRWREGTRR